GARHRRAGSVVYALCRLHRLLAEFVRRTYAWREDGHDCEPKNGIAWLISPGDGAISDVDRGTVWGPLIRAWADRRAKAR
ncbi:hypothetical protein, partial [Xanthomonas albilineans]|uniref:hypothetical protein n=1 Tax=Xanthomonas albilineans TaxID=29447 RepID=UPI001E36BBC2